MSYIAANWWLHSWRGLSSLRCGTPGTVIQLSRTPTRILCGYRDTVSGKTGRDSYQ